MGRRSISEEVIRKIIEDSVHGDERARVADRYGVSVSTVVKIVKGIPQADHYHKGGVISRQIWIK